MIYVSAMLTEQGAVFCSLDTAKDHSADFVSDYTEECKEHKKPENWKAACFNSSTRTSCLIQSRDMKRKSIEFYEAYCRFMEAEHSGFQKLDRYGRLDVETSDVVELSILEKAGVLQDENIDVTKLRCHTLETVESSHFQYYHNSAFGGSKTNRRVGLCYLFIKKEGDTQNDIENRKKQLADINTKILQSIPGSKPIHIEKFEDIAIEQIISTYSNNNELDLVLVSVPADAVSCENVSNNSTLVKAVKADKAGKPVSCADRNVLKIYSNVSSKGCAGVANEIYQRSGGPILPASR